MLRPYLGESMNEPRQVPRPTDAELAILSVLWERGPSTVRDVHDDLSSTQATGYTTILKLLQIMTEKGLGDADEPPRGHIYEARCGERRRRGTVRTDVRGRR